MRCTVRQAIRLGSTMLLLLPLSGCADSELVGVSAGVNPQSSETSSQSQADAPAETPQEGKLTESPEPLTEEELAEGWIALFDGHTLFGWQPQTEANWRVEDGAIVVDRGDKGLLCSTTQFADYILKLEFRSAAGTNSGIFLHTPLRDEVPDQNCYELNIAGRDNPFPTGSLVNRAKAEGVFESDDWQAYEVTLEGAHVTVQLDGETILEYTDPKPLRRGHIGLQLNRGKVEFRNIQLKPLGLPHVFNGKDLTGWKEYPEMASRFTVTEKGWLNVKHGRGQLETEKTYGDFVLQLECITHAPALNSGIFFRCIPGETMNGYESQIHNAFKGEDRTAPVDHGTGGIFRRQPARLVVADDQVWFHNTIIADGPHMAVWVNGCQVSDWTDEREPNENPRRGLRVEPGTIMIQGHDPTTDISFRNIRVAETPPRSE
ncbi:MAG: DUF1080 domain-containing protein [Pirellulaceae bacterium]